MASELNQPRPFSCEELEAKLCLSGASFATHDIFVNEAVSVHAADADCDEDLDVLSALPLSWPVSDDDKDTIAWHEHLSPPNTPGDANRNYRFDQLDIVQVLQAGRYLMTHRTALGAVNWEEGDWNGDGVFDELDIVAALETDNYLRGPYAENVRDAVFAETDR